MNGIAFYLMSVLTSVFKIGHPESAMHFQPQNQAEQYIKSFCTLH